MRRAAVALALHAGVVEAAPTVRPRVVAEYPHDPQAFTQGLVLYEQDFYESTGLRGRSTLRRVDPATGNVELSIALPDSEFGEGLARVSDRLLQLTWQEGIAHVYDLESFEAEKSFSYDGEGWGLCFDGERLVMSDGSSQLFFRDPTSFELLGALDVTDGGEPVEELNELECVGSLVLANVWMTDRIVAIDSETGEVLTNVDASGLLSDEQAANADVLNGIAYDADSRHYYLTGKLWPALFEVELDLPEPREERPGAVDSKGGGCAMCALHDPGLARLPFFGVVLVAALGARRRFNPAGGRSPGRSRRSRCG